MTNTNKSHQKLGYNVFYDEAMSHAFTALANTFLMAAQSRELGPIIARELLSDKNRVADLLSLVDKHNKLLHECGFCEDKNCEYKKISNK